jgi:hypothetical protein
MDGRRDAVSQIVFHATIGCFRDRHPSAIRHARAFMTVGGHGLLATPVGGQ